MRMRKTRCNKNSKYGFVEKLTVASLLRLSQVICAFMSSSLQEQLVVTKFYIFWRTPNSTMHATTNSFYTDRQYT